jgi:hypothetical protein
MDTRKLLRAAACAAAFCGGFAFGQGGPWTDGEIVVMAPSVAPATGLSLYRIAPETGHGTALISGFSGYGGWSGKIVFDPYRDALLVNLALPPDGPFTYKLWAVASDGSKTAIPGLNGAALRAMAAVGDGRIYFQTHGTGSPTEPIKYLDAANVVHTLLDANGSAPFPFPVEHLLYHAPTNSLLASTSNWWSTNDCNPLGGSVFRIPLSADGSQVAGPVVCASTSNAYAAEEIMALDYLPGGDVLAVLAVGIPGTTIKRLKRFNPFTMVVSDFADPTYLDVNGGCWSSRIGAAVILEDSTKTLRAYAANQSGSGTQIVCDVPLGDSSTEYSPAESLWEIDLNGSACNGLALPYGVGTAGTGGFTPTLDVVGCPTVGSAFSFVIGDAVGSGAGVFLVGPGPASIPVFGGEVLVDFWFWLDLVSDGAPGVGGVGTVNIPFFTADPAFFGQSVYVQAAFLDAGAVQGVSFTNGLHVSIG